MREVYEKYNVFEDKHAKELGVMPLIEKAYKNGEGVNLPAVQYDPLEMMKTSNFNEPSGRKRWVQCRIYPTKDEGGRILNLVHIEEDITERKEAEEQVSILKSELLHSARVGGMVELTAALAHEINHPLGSILNNASAAKRFLENKSPDLDEIREIISDIISEDKRASDVIKKLRDFMKKKDTEYEPLNINSIIRGVLKLTNSEIVIDNISLTKQLRKKLPKLNGDRVQLQQVLLNLIINAIDAMKESKVKNLCISTDKNDSQDIVVCVADSGTGFDESKKDSLFKPFFTTKKEGMGLGLSLNRTIINAHGGEIWAENNKDGGASFFIKLPINKDELS
jgi:C4-dicarboxylate-specific signal transduction histidine kinase